MWQQKVAQALARRRAEELARKRAEAEARARQAQQQPTPPKSSSPLAKLVKMGLFIIALGGVGLAGGSVQVVESPMSVATEMVNNVLNPPNNSQELEFCGPVAMFCPFGNGAGGGGGSIILSDWFRKAAEAVAPAIGAIANIIVRYIQQEIVEVVVDAFTPDTDDVIENVDALTQARAEEGESQYIVLFHYTFVNNVGSIIEGGLNASGTGNSRRGDARYGPGQYFTDLTPIESSFLTREEHSIALFNTPLRWGTPPTASDIGWIVYRFNIADANVRWVDSLHLAKVAYRSIFLRDSTSTLVMNPENMFFSIITTGTVFFWGE